MREASGRQVLFKVLIITINRERFFVLFFMFLI